MKYLIISDVHSNLPALEAVMQAAPKKSFDRVICLGDAVGYNPYPNECLEKTDAYADRFVPGNHDMAVYNIFCRSHGRQSSAIHTDFEFNSSALFAARWNAERLTPKSFGILEKIVHQDYSFMEGELVFSHGSPLKPERMDYIDEKLIFKIIYDARKENQFSGRLSFVGHTHIPQAYAAGRKGEAGEEIVGGDVIFNPSEKEKDSGKPLMKKVNFSSCEFGMAVVPSIGQPRDWLNYTGWAEYDTETGSVRFFRVPYKMDGLLEKVKESAETGLPDCRSRIRNGC
jgi:predicted phosphodiesterase